MFMLSLAQWDIPLELQTMMDCAGIKVDDTVHEKYSNVLKDVRTVRELVHR